MVVLYAFIENYPFDDDVDCYVCGWVPVAYLHTLRDMPKEQFKYFVKFYGKHNLRLRCEM